MKAVSGMITRLIHWSAAAGLAFGAVALLVVAETPSPPTGGVEAAPSRDERVLISPDAKHHGILSALFKRLLGNPKSVTLSHTGSKVWMVPHSKMANLEEKLESLGIKFALLRNDWNHILRRNKTPMSAKQKEVLENAARSPARIGTSLMRAPEVAVAEYALTETPEPGHSRILIPFSDDQQISLMRTSATRTDKGVIWRGMVEDTGETAILQWWKDGRLTLLFGYRGHIYSAQPIVLA
jgi:hypothetical protein